LTNIPELVILKYILIYNNYIKYNKYININSELKELEKVFRSLRVLHERYPGTDKTLDELEAMVWASYPHMRLPEKEAISDLLGRIEEIEVRDAVVLDLVTSIQRRSDATALARKAVDAVEGRSPWDELVQAANDIVVSSNDGNYIDRIKSRFVTDDIDELENLVVNTPGLPWRLRCLNRSLGPLRLGDFGFVFARPERGKTTFLADQVTYMAEHATGPILWFNNEEQGYKVRIRTIQASLGIALDELWAKKKDNIKKYYDKTKRNINIIDDADTSRRDVEALVAEMKPSLIIFDQIDKIRGFDADRPDLVYGKIYQWARELAKKWCPIIGVCQSDGTGEGVKWLTMAHVAEAKTSKQAEADWIVGIGASNEENMDFIRHLNISKNKLLGGQDSDPNERHGRYHVFIKPDIARYEDIEE